jgi:hypothetical protein
VGISGTAHRIHGSITAAPILETERFDPNKPSRHTDTRRPSNMHTRLIEADTTPEPRTDLDTTVAEQVIGILKAEPA